MSEVELLRILTLKLWIKKGAKQLTNTSFRKRIEQKLSRASVPKYFRDKHEGRSTGGSGDAYNNYRESDGLIVSLLLFVPPLMPQWSQQRIPACPGAETLLRIINNVKFDSLGWAIPVDLWLAQNQGPSRSLMMQSHGISTKN